MNGAKRQNRLEPASHRHTSQRKIGLSCGLLVIALVMTSCGSEGRGAAVTGGLSGEITISGSSTVEPISIGVAEAFSGKAPGVGISVDGPGTGDGFELFCRGEIDIADASRPISDEEIEACTQAGVDFVEMKVAIDGIAVLSSPDNSEVTDCLSFSDIYALVGPESQGFNRWSAANTLAAELDNTKAAPFPNIPLSITAPGEESGTYDSFVELVLEDIAENRGKVAQSRPDYQASADDNIIVRGIQSEGGSFGWVGYAFFEANRDSVRAFEIAGEDGNCVEPSPETIADGSYPIARPLYIYANVAKVEENQALAEFLDFYLSDEGISAVTNAGYVELPEDELDFSRQSLESRRIGRQDH